MINSLFHLMKFDQSEHVLAIHQVRSCIGV
jgi:hypothetical protein